MNILTFECEQNDSFNKGNFNKIWQFEQNKTFWTRWNDKMLYD